MMVSGNVTFGYVRSTNRTFKYWANLSGYNGEPVKENLPDTDPTDGRTIERYTYKKKGKPEVVLLKVIGGKNMTILKTLMCMKRPGSFLRGSRVIFTRGLKYSS